MPLGHNKGTELPICEKLTAIERVRELVAYLDAVGDTCFVVGGRRIYTDDLRALLAFEELDSARRLAMTSGGAELVAALSDMKFLPPGCKGVPGNVAKKAAAMLQTAAEALEIGLEYVIEAANSRKQKDAVFDNAMRDIKRIEATLERLSR